MATQAQQIQQDDEREHDILVVQQSGDAFQVYAAEDPGKVYHVSGDPENPQCTCADFRWHRNQPGYKCNHIVAVCDKLDSGEAIDDVAPAMEPEPFTDNGQPAGISMPAQMVLKRSVSPDGRIDSLSVEFALNCDTTSRDTIVDDAHAVLRLQETIVRCFFGDPGQHKRENQRGNGGNNGHDAPASDGTTKAWMEGIDGMQTKYGWRYYIVVKVNGQVAKLFGTRKQILEYLADAGYPEKNPNIQKGKSLRHACQAVTRMSDDGKYLQIERVMPANGQVPYGERVH